MKLTFGKHAGTDSMDLPLSYLEWGSKNLSNAMWQKEFERVLNLRTSSERLMRKAQIANSECPETDTLDFYYEYQAEEAEMDRLVNLYKSQVEMTIDRLISTGLFGSDRGKLKKAIENPENVIFTSKEKEVAFNDAMDYLASSPCR